MSKINNLRDPGRARITRHCLLAAVLCACVYVYSRGTPVTAPAAPLSETYAVRFAAADKFDWYKLPPSETLEWVRCYEEPFQCARLEVPLDYAKPHGQKAAVALIKYPAKYPVGHEKWRGPILFNPGGPGESGVETVHSIGMNVSKIIGDEYDMIGFDPRGVVDAENYYSGAWDNNLMDTDKELTTLFDSCAASSSCPLHEKTGELVSQRLDAILERLKTEPIAVRNGSTYGIVDYALAHERIFRALYKPVTSLPPLFAAFAEVESGNGQPLYALAELHPSSWRCDCTDAPESVEETTVAIACGDADVVNHDLHQLKKHYANMARLSSFADMWTAHAHAWKVRPVERYNGPFGGNTSFPVLFIGNTADPVTPLWAAKKMAKGFKDAVVLTQNSPGHCSIAAASLCTAKYIRAYFRDGTLPAQGTVCEDNEDVFPPDEKVTDELPVMSTEDRELFSAARDLSAGFEVPHFGLV
ncbi:hypothetical protein EXIGLDRAFT_842389 [Exidia glandulosa HHB12029]|uniref:Peptidase S33 tripeptidyl aminopeptidase-like C-terminal domain-containing protein n=1 Tax=Exidia glandulosa HHB12029 TaxID=1314781 RepID=A0A165DC38_EXIGL|nr:hypothetical protein EXIGLDRAFT_842389 [Exidia glandulosa HHB12029]